MKNFLFADAVAAAPAQTAAVETAPAAVGEAPAAPAAGGGMGMLVPMLIIFGIFYFMMIRPQQRKEKQRRQMIEELRAGAQVIFAGGLIGRIVEARDKTFRIAIAGDVVVEVLRSAVQDVVKPDEPAAK